MNVPKLRFSKYNEEWNKIDLSNVFSYFSTNSFSREQLSFNGIIKNLHYGDIHKNFGVLVDVSNDINTYIKDQSFKNKYELCKENDLIIADASEDYEGIGKATEVININDNKIISGLHTIMVRDTKNIFSPKFKGYYFNSPSIHNQIRVLANGFKVFGISKDTINSLNAYIPSKDEQKDIANMLQLLDKKIELQSKKVKALKLYKKGLNKTIFSNCTQKHKIDDIITEYNKKTTINNQYDVLSSTTSGIYLQNQYFNKQAASDDNTGYKIIPRGFITYRSMSDTGSFYFNIQNLVDYGIVSPAYPVFNISDDLVNKDYFIYYLNEDNKFKRSILSTKEGGTRYALSISKFKNIYITLPSKEEQNRLAKLLNSYNRKLEQEILKFNKLIEFKKGLMQNMFI